MKPKIAEIVPQEDWDLLKQTKLIIAALPDELLIHAFMFGIRMPRKVAESHFIPNCHVFTRALARFLPVDFHDGIITETKPGGKQHRHEHSWLTRKGGDGRVIIDPWPLGAVSGPALFVQDYAFHFGQECSVLYHRSKKFKWEVAAVRSAIRKILKKQDAKLKAAP